MLSTIYQLFMSVAAQQVRAVASSPSGPPAPAQPPTSASGAASEAASSPLPPSTYHVSSARPPTAGQPLLEAFVSFSIEFASFPDYAGNASAPNRFSDALLTNLGDAAGTKPYIRVGGNTQDYALYDASLPVALLGTYNSSRSLDYPTTVRIGPAFFESYATWSPGVHFSHGFNLALAPTPQGWYTLEATVPLVCAALAGNHATLNATGKLSSLLYTWEYGNEPDLLSTSAQGPTRPANWSEAAYVTQWHNGTQRILQLVAKHCPAAAAAGFMAPSFAGVNNHLKARTAWQAGLGADQDIVLFSTHNYISGAASPGVTLQGTLMNHTNTAQSVDAHVAEYESIFGLDNASTVSVSNTQRRPRLVMGETNSLYNEGKPGLSNAFGAALWGIDFSLYCAARGFGRVHMHQGMDYRYAAWQPVTTNLTSRGTKPPYYGSMATAAALGDTGRHSVSVAVATPVDGRLGDDTTGSSSPFSAAYAIYVDDRLARLLVLNMHGYNTTANGTGLGFSANPLPPRPSRNYTFVLVGNSTTSTSITNNSTSPKSTVLVQRLLANGSDAISGITWDGWSYNVELAAGRPVRLNNVTTGERLSMHAGQVTVGLPDSSAALLTFQRPSSAPSQGL